MRLRSFIINTSSTIFLLVYIIINCACVFKVCSFKLFTLIEINWKFIRRVLFYQTYLSPPAFDRAVGTSFLIGIFSSHYIAFPPIFLQLFSRKTKIITIVWRWYAFISNMKKEKGKCVCDFLFCDQNHVA